VTATSTSEDRLMVNFSFGAAINCEKHPREARPFFSTGRNS
jgi:hypothetical protein